MAAHQLKTVQKIPAPLQEVWDFFATPDNLKVITPASMGFTILSKEDGSRMYKGQIIEYKVRPFLGITLYWMTEIADVRDKELFIDEQRKGPFRLWHHEHHFKAIDGGTEMTDVIQYKIPFGILGRFVNWLFVRKKIQMIFLYRYDKAEELFGKWE